MDTDSLDLAFYYARGPNFGDEPATWFLVGSTRAQKDQILRMVLRVAKWSFAFTYSKEPGHSQDYGPFVSDGPGMPGTITRVLVSGDQSPEEALNPLYYWSWEADEPAPNQGLSSTFSASFSLRQDSRDLYGYFGCDIAVGVDPGVVLRCGTTGTPGGVPTQNVLTFLDQTWPLQSGDFAPNHQEYYGDPDTSGKRRGYRYASVSLVITPQEYWSWGGFYDPATGAPA